MRKPNHIPALDGMRGIGLLIVLIGHFRYSLFYGHSHYALLAQFIAEQFWFIMDTFFALSGFLITGILLDTIHSRNYFRGFYLRRTLRIFPIYYAVLLFVTALAALDHFRGYGRLVFDWVYLQNYLPGANMWMDKRFSLDHTWSLAVEEQFYLLWPIVLWKVRSRKALAWVCGLLIIAEPIGRAIAMQMGKSPESISHWTFFRLDGMMCGALAALAVRMAPEEKFRSMLRLARVAFMACLAIIAVLYWKASGLQAAAWAPMIYSIASTAVILLAYRKRGFTSRLCSKQIFQWLGKYSYGIYLFHFIFIFRLEPIAAWLRLRMEKHLAGVVVAVGYMSIVTLIAWLSYNFYEVRFIRLKDRLAPRKEPRSTEEREKLLMAS